ncbi:unnamed protein product [Rhodiola kirilowii]
MLGRGFGAESASALAYEGGFDNRKLKGRCGAVKHDGEGLVCSYCDKTLWCIMANGVAFYCDKCYDLLFGERFSVASLVT